MSPDSLAAELVALGATVAAAVVLAAVWSAGRGWRRPLIRTAAVAACVVAAAATALIGVNRQVDTYPTWSSLVGSGGGEGAPPAAAGSPGAGRILTWSVSGRTSGLTLPVYVYLPPGYDDAPDTRFPVVEALHGYPGTPLTWLNRLGVRNVLDREIGAGRMAPTVVLFPYQTPDPMLDTECANLTGGPQTETFLTVDVPAAARARLHVRTDAAGWGLTGYSAGGYCASNLLLRHPTEYAAAASLSGYATPGIRIGDGTEHTTYDDVWRLRHLPVPAVQLYLACARTDRNAMRDTLALARAVRAPLTVTTAYIPDGGHNAPTWEAMEAPAFDWLSGVLAGPLAGDPPVSPVAAGR